MLQMGTIIQNFDRPVRYSLGSNIPRKGKKSKNLVRVQILLANLNFIGHNFGTNPVRKLQLVPLSCKLFALVIGNI